VCFLSLTKKLTDVAHDGWPHATVVAHDGCKAASCRRQGHCNHHRSPRRLDLKPLWATTNGCQNCKILKLSFIFCKIIKKYIKNSRNRGAALLLLWIFAQAKWGGGLLAPRKMGEKLPRAEILQTPNTA
jgi:hypothetical protein